jgi:hypothetical protein
MKDRPSRERIALLIVVVVLWTGLAIHSFTEGNSFSGTCYLVAAALFGIVLAGTVRQRRGVA